MLDDLVSVIETLKQRIHDHGTSLRANETRTRMAMIDPMLRALGWDPADPSVVTPEYDVSGRWADYALLGTDGKPAATLEAKKLGESLGTHRMQMLNYSNAAGIAYAGLTDGNHWELYEVFAQKPLEERRVLQLSIVDTPAHQCALQLLLLWRPNLASGRPILASEPISANNTASAEPQETAAPSPAPLAPAALPTSGDGWVPLSEFNPPTGTNPPSSIRFSDGNNVAIRSWKEIPTAVARWLHARRMLTVGNLPVASGKRGMAANSVPLHRDGSSMVTHETIGDDEIFINVHLSPGHPEKTPRRYWSTAALIPVMCTYKLGSENHHLRPGGYRGNDVETGPGSARCRFGGASRLCRAGCAGASTQKGAG